MTTINNSNGSIYYVMAKFEANGENVLLLASYGNKSAESIQAGATPIKYIVARNWREQYKCWDSGKYYMIYDHDYETVLEAAKESFKDNVDRIMYDIF